MECVFCRRIERSEFEGTDDTTVWFKPLNPVTHGHKLFVPIRHVADAAEMSGVTADVYRLAARKAKEWQWPFNLITSAGVAATQTVFHLHVHYIPRSVGDGLHLPWTV